MADTKFQFTIEFQLDLLKFTVQDINGYKALNLYTDYYFTLTDHAIIAYTLKRYFKTKRRVPGLTILLEEVNKSFSEKQFRDLLTVSDRSNIIDICKDLYKGTVKDGEDILEKTEKFSQFVDLKAIVEEVDLTNYNQYDQFSKQVQKAVSPKLIGRDHKGAFLVTDVKERQFDRQDRGTILPTPWKQINRMTNAGGYSKGSIIVILDKPKKFKTGMLMNTARGYMRLQKRVLVIDLENGEDELTIRVEQAIINKDKKQILTGEFDRQIQKALRKYKRLGVELVIKRMPAIITTANDISNYIDLLYREYGIRVDVLIIDFMGKMGCLAGKENISERISEAYIEVANLALEKNIEHVWTAQHVTRAASVREASRYEGNDVAGDINIIRNAQAIWGLNRTETEEAAGIQRLELVDQRDGKPKGRAVYWVNAETQRLTEMTKEQRAEFDEQFKHLDNKPEEKVARKPRKKDIEDESDI